MHIKFSAYVGVLLYILFKYNRMKVEQRRKKRELLRKKRAVKKLRLIKGVGTQERRKRRRKRRKN